MKKILSILLTLVLAAVTALAQHPLTELAARVNEASAQPEKSAAMKAELKQAISEAQDPSFANFLVGQFRLLAGEEDIPQLAAYAQNPALAATALDALAQLEGSEEALLALVQGEKADRAQLCTAVAAKGLFAAEPTVLNWAMNTDDAAVKAAATAALGRIGSSAETANFLKDNSPEDYINLLSGWLEEGDAEAVAKNARPLLKGSDHIRTAAAGLLLHALPAKKAEKLLKSAMTDANRAYRNAVLAEADAALGTEAVVAAVADKSFQKLSGSAKTDIVRYLGNHKVGTQSELLATCLDGDEETAAAACEAMGKIGGEYFLSRLIGELGGSNADAALRALLSFPGDISEAVTEAAEKGTTSAKRLFTLASARHITAVAPVALRYADSRDVDTHAMAMRSLPGMVGPGQTAALTSRLDQAAPADVPGWQEALAASLRTLSANEQYDKVFDILHDARHPERFYAALAQSGTDDAVKVLSEAIASDEAFDALLKIENYQAAKPLLEQAKAVPARCEKAVSRYTELVQAYENDPVRKRIGYARALELSPKPAVTQKILLALSQLPTMKAFQLAGRYLDDPDLGTRAQAANAVRRIASKTTEEIDNKDLQTLLGKARVLFSEGGGADDGYAVDEIDKILSELKPAPLSQLTDEEKAQGFEMLFDGSGLDKWHGDREGYTPVNGTLYVSAGYGSTGNLYTNKEYRNFVYRFEFCFLTPGVNNGVGVRTPEGVDAAYQGMCEVQILDHDAPQYAKLREYQVHGSVYGVIPAKRIVHKPLGEWSTEEIRVEGDHIQVTVNGEVIVDGDVRKAAAKGTVDGREHPGLTNKKGFISFCGHGEGLKIRNVRILDLGERK